MSITNAISIDLEEWFTVYNFSKIIDRSTWESLDQRAEKSVRRLLDIFFKHDVKATFFVLGWVAERNPTLIGDIADAGHEIATHGYGHELVKEIGPERFRADLEHSLNAIKKATHHEVIGYRAPSFSVHPELDWFFETLHEFGIKYDSSLFPVQFHPDYANSDVPLDPYKINENITEFPMTCIPLLGKNIPCSGGGYFRLLPYQWFKWGIGKINREGRTAIFYLHPWEIDPDQPRVTNLPLSKKIRHYTNLSKCEARLEQLLTDFKFGTVRQVLGL